MTDERKTAIALIAGSLGGILTMVIHPVASGGHADQLAVISGVAHSLAMVSVVVTFLGACGLMRWLNDAGRLAFSATVVYGFAAVAVLIATAVSGFIVPEIMKLAAKDAGANSGEWRIAIASIFQINQAFSKIYTLGVAAAIGMWSICGMRQGVIGRFIAIYGCAVAPLTVMALASGHLRLNVHGMMAVVLTEAVWFVALGAKLWR